MPGPTAEELRKVYRAMPKEQRDAHQSFAIRVWRAMSWLERAEQAAEVEDHFIALWIAFNALYGRLDDTNRATGDRETMRAFLSEIWELDTDGQLKRILNRRSTTIMKLVNSKYLYRPFWATPYKDHEPALRVIAQKLLPRFGTSKLLPVLGELFDRLYVMRNQVFHGASTKGSRLNRKALTDSAGLLAAIMPVMIEIMLSRGIDHDWGDVCFPPVA